MDKITKLGTGMILKRGNKILLGFRKKNNTWTLPGGKVEIGETVLQCVVRETEEECGIKVKGAKFINLCDADHDGFATVGFSSEEFIGDPIVMEPEKIVDWQWFDLNNLPKPVFAASEILIEKYRKGFFY